MHRGRNTRLDRLVRRTAADGAAVDHRRLVATHAAIGAAVRWSLAQHGIDPALVPALRAADEAAAELAESDDPPPPLADQTEGECDRQVGLEVSLDAAIGRLVERYRGSSCAAPDFARASLAELLA